MSLQLHSSSLTLLLTHRRPLILLTLFFYFLLLTTPIYGEIQAHSNEHAIETHPLKRALHSPISSTGSGDTNSAINDKSDNYSGYSTHDRSEPSIHNNQAALNTAQFMTLSLETSKPMDSSTPTPTDNTDHLTPSDTPTEQVNQGNTGIVTQEAPVTEATETVSKGSTETEVTTQATSAVTASYQTTDTTEVIVSTTPNDQSTVATTESATYTILSTSTTDGSTSPTNTEPLTSSTPISRTTPIHSDTAITESSSATTVPAPATITTYSSLSNTNTNLQSTTIAISETATTTTSELSFSYTLYTTRSFSITSSTAVPSLVLGKNECATDIHAVNGMCPDNYFCNAVLKTCIPLKNNGEQCYEDFQCLSSYCGKVCADAPSTSPVTTLTGGQIAGVTLGCVSGAVLLVLGLIRWQKRSRQLHSRAARFRDFEQQEEMDGSARLSKYNFLAQVLHADQSATRRASQDTNHYDIDDTQFYASTQHLSMDSSPHFYDPGLHPPPGSRTTTKSGSLAMDLVPSGVLTRTSGGTDHNPFRAPGNRNYDYF